MKNSHVCDVRAMWVCDIDTSRMEKMIACFVICGIKIYEDTEFFHSLWYLDRVPQGDDGGDNKKRMNANCCKN